MIPLGNWQDRIDELESENHDRAYTISGLEEEVAELLFQLDEMKDIVSKTVDARVKAQAERDNILQDYANAIEELGYEYRRAEKAEATLHNTERYLEDEKKRVSAAMARADKAEIVLARVRVAAHFPQSASGSEIVNAVKNTQNRANSWFDAAKELVRARDFWIRLFEKQFDKRLAAENEQKELKAALRALGQ